MSEETDVVEGEGYGEEQQAITCGAHSCKFISLYEGELTDRLGACKKRVIAIDFEGRCQGYERRER